MIGVPISDPKTPPYTLIRAEPSIVLKMFTHIAYGESPTGHILDSQLVVTGLPNLISDMISKVTSSLPFSPDRQCLFLCQPGLVFLHCGLQG